MVILYYLVIYFLFFIQNDNFCLNSKSSHSNRKIIIEIPFINRIINYNYDRKIIIEIPFINRIINYNYELN